MRLINLSVCNPFAPRVVLIVGIVLAREKTARAVRRDKNSSQGRISRKSVRINCIKVPRRSLKILQRLKRFLTPKLLPPSIYSRAKLSVIYRRAVGRTVVEVCSLSLSPSLPCLFLSVSLSLSFFPLPSSLGGAFVCLAKPVFDRAGLRAAISGPRAPSSLPPPPASPRPSYPVRHLQRFKLAALSYTRTTFFFFPRACRA